MAVIFYSDGRIYGATTYDRFNTKYKISNTGCWEWQGLKSPKGYGKFQINGKSRFAHRVSYTLFIGELNSVKELVCHTCDNPSCVNPFHLFKGDNKANMNDAQSKGRLPVAYCPSYRMYAKGCRCDKCVIFYREKSRLSARRLRAKNKTP